MPYLVLAAIQSGYVGDVVGLTCRLSWSIREGESHWQRQADKAQWTIRRTIRAMFGRWAPPAAIICAVNSENEKLGRPLSSWEVRDILRNEEQRFLHGTRQTRRRHA
jgi:hypothetical protein